MDSWFVTIALVSPIVQFTLVRRFCRLLGVNGRIDHHKDLTKYTVFHMNPRGALRRGLKRTQLSTCIFPILAKVLDLRISSVLLKMMAFICV